MKLALLCALGVAIAFAQAPPKLAFEVASIKPAPKGNNIELMREGKMHYNVDDARVDLGAIEMMNLLVNAFELPFDQIKAPEWTSDARFDVLGKIPAGGNKKQVPQMILAMLEDRFKLQYHREQKILPVYELKVASGGVKFKESTADQDRRGMCNGGGGHQVCTGGTMAGLASRLTDAARMGAMNQMAAQWAPDRPVIDATGLTGEYDYVAGWGMIGVRRPGVPEPIGEPTAVTAAEGLKALGLRLEPAKHAFDYIIIDHLERVPTEN